MENLKLPNLNKARLVVAAVDLHSRFSDNYWGFLFRFLGAKAFAHFRIFVEAVGHWARSISVLHDAPAIDSTGHIGSDSGGSCFDGWCEISLITFQANSILRKIRSIGARGCALKSFAIPAPVRFRSWFCLLDSLKQRQIAFESSPKLKQISNFDPANASERMEHPTVHSRWAVTMSAWRSRIASALPTNDFL
jgi:hypothetical protein